MDIVKIGLLGLVAVAITLFIKQYRPEYAFVFMLAVGLFLFYLCFDAFLTVADVVQKIGAGIGAYDGYIQMLLKIVGIAYISEFCSNMCQDAGYSALGKQIEMAGKFCVLLMGMPVFLSLVQTIEEYF